MSRTTRPIGVTLVGVLYLVLGVLALLGALGILLVPSIGQSQLASKLPRGPFWLVDGGSFLLAFLGLALFLVAVIDIIIALGCFRGWGWIWTWGMIFAVINIAISMFNALAGGITMGTLWVGIIGSIVPLIVLCYMCTRKVREYFGWARSTPGSG